LINPNGVVFSSTAKVNVGGLVATTLDTSNADFLAGKANLEQNPNQSGAAVVNQGQITARDGGHVALVAPVVDNSGQITVHRGTVDLAAGTQAVVDVDSAGLVSVAVPNGPAGTS